MNDLRLVIGRHSVRHRTTFEAKNVRFWCQPSVSQYIINRLLCNLVNIAQFNHSWKSYEFGLHSRRNQGCSCVREPRTVSTTIYSRRGSQWLGRPRSLVVTNTPNARGRSIRPGTSGGVVRRGRLLGTQHQLVPFRTVRTAREQAEALVGDVFRLAVAAARTPERSQRLAP